MVCIRCVPAGKLPGNGCHARCGHADMASRRTGQLAAWELAAELMKQASRLERPTLAEVWGTEVCGISKGTSCLWPWCAGLHRAF
eukprot:364939-Chlamydomonas_euryale.AAC.10